MQPPGPLEWIVSSWDMEMARKTQHSAGLIYRRKTLIKQFFDTKHSNGYLDPFQYIMSPFAFGDVTKL